MLAQNIYQLMLGVRRAGYLPGWILLGQREYQHLMLYIRLQKINSLDFMWSQPIDGPLEYRGCKIARVDMLNHLEVTIKGL